MQDESHWRGRQLPGDKRQRAMRPAFVTVTLLLMAAAAHAAPSLRVRARVHVDLQGMRAADGIRLHGTVTDDLAAPLGARELQIRVQPELAQSRGQTRTLRSDDAGRFSALFETASVAQRVSVSFEGDDFYDRAEAAQTIDVDRSELRLQFLQPKQLQVTLDETPTRIVIGASSAIGGAALTIVIQDELARPIARGTTTRDGTLTLDVSTQRLGEVGLGELIATTNGDDSRGAATTRQPLLRTRATQLRMHVLTDTKAQKLRLSVQLMAANGPLAQRAVGVFLDDAHLITLLTNGRGEADRQLGPESAALVAGKHRLVARFESDAPGWLPSRSRALDLTIAPLATQSAAWLLIPALASLAFVAWSLRCAASADDPSSDAPGGAPVVRFGTIVRGRAELDVIDGRVEDVENGMPLAATVEIIDPHGHALQLMTDLDARFVSAALPAESYRIRVWAPGYSSAEFAVRVPHSGTASGIAVSLRNLRSVALDAHAMVARHVLNAETQLHVATVRDTFEAAVSGNAAATSLAQLTELVERTAYARATPNDRDLHEVQRVAAAALADLEARGSTTGDPSLEQ